MSEILNGKVAVITGGSRGLGLAIARAYTRAGAKVVIASRSQQSVEVAVKSLREDGAQVTGMACDVADIARVEELAEHAIQAFGRIDIWVNNAGLSAPYGPTAHIPSRDFLNVVNTNIIGTYNGSVVAVRKMSAQKRGKVINLLGRGDSGSITWQNPYTSSKVWVRNFTKTLAKEYKDSGIEIIGFNPGLGHTEMLSQVHAMAGFEKKMRPLSIIAPLWGNEVDVPADQALWLASSATDGKTGLMVTMLTAGFMLRRVASTGLRWLLRRPIKKLDLSISPVEPVKELAPVHIKNRDTQL